jgi:hypothetical protein
VRVTLEAVECLGYAQDLEISRLEKANVAFQMTSLQGEYWLCYLSAGHSGLTPNSCQDALRETRGDADGAFDHGPAVSKAG